VNTKNYLFLKIRIFFNIKNRFKISKKIFLKYKNKHNFNKLLTGYLEGNKNPCGWNSFCVATKTTQENNSRRSVCQQSKRS